MQQPSHDSLYLLQASANEQIVERLYEKELINQQGKEFALDFIQPPRWGYWAARLLKILGFWLIVAGLALIFITHWQHMSVRYQQISLFMGLLCCVYGAFTYADKRKLSQLLLGGAIVLAGINGLLVEHLHRSKNIQFAFIALTVLLVIAFIIRGLPMIIKRRHQK